MAFPSDVMVYVMASTDSIAKKAQDLLQVVEASSNKCDENMNFWICLTIMVVALFVCLAVFLCFRVVARIKRETKEKDCDLEILKIVMNNELQELRDFKTKSEKEKNKEKKAQESCEQAQKRDDLLNKIQSLLEKTSDVKVIVKSGGDVIEVSSGKSIGNVNHVSVADIRNHSSENPKATPKS